jgi:hypothetical protein
MLAQEFCSNFATCWYQPIEKRMFNIPVRIERIEKQRRNNGLLHSIAGIYLLVTGITSVTVSNAGKFFLLPVLITGIIAAFYPFIRKKISNPAAFNSRLRLAEAICFFSLAVLFLVAKNYWNTFGLFAWALVSAMLYRNEKKLFEETSLSLEENGIRIPGLPSDHLLPWEMIVDFVARPDFTTITRQDNKYVQVEVSHKVDEAELEKANNYSRERIAAATP